MALERGEDHLCGIFAEAARGSNNFAEWLLRKTKFEPIAGQARLLADEQARRPAKAWWRHWWCTVPSPGRQSETDIFLAFAVPGTNTRFALHVENKIDAPFAPYQAEDYSLRAAHMRTNRWVPYSDWTTLLIAPRRYVNRNASSCGLFDTVLTYEEIASHVPEFASYCSREV